jgi:hypothetical protein
LSFEEWAHRHKKNIDSFYEWFFINRVRNLTLFL